MPDYSLYGLVVRCNCAIDGLLAAAPEAHVDVDIALGEPCEDDAGWSRSPVHYVTTDEPGALPSVEVRRDAEHRYWFRYADGTAFVIDAAGGTIRGWWKEPSTLEDTITYLLGPVLGFALRLRGVLAFHASAVLINGRAVGLLGPSGAGKSTTAAAFAAAGVPVLADDVVAVRILDGVPMAYPSYRLIRLWDESEQILFGTVGQLPRLTPTWDKRALPLGTAHPFHAAPAPLGALFILAPRVDDARAPYTEALTARAAFMALVENSYANYLLDDEMRRAEMRALALVHRGRTVRRLVPHRDPARLHDLVQAVQAAVAALGDE